MLVKVYWEASAILISFKQTPLGTVRAAGGTQTTDGAVVWVGNTWLPAALPSWEAVEPRRWDTMTSSFLTCPDLSHLPQPFYFLNHGRWSPVKLWSKIYLSPHIPNLWPTNCSEGSPHIITRERTVKTNILIDLSPLVRNAVYTI